jgi:hypothetical protein
MNGNSLLEKIVDYCETFNQDPKEIGDILQDCEEFKDILYKDCVKNNIIKDSNLVIKDEIDIW